MRLLHILSAPIFPKSHILGPDKFVGRQGLQILGCEIDAIKCSRKILVLSSRNSVANNTSVFESTSCKTVLYTSPLQHLVDELRGQTDVTFLKVLSWEEMAKIATDVYPYTKTFQEAWNGPVIILHTSGSRGKWSLLWRNWNCESLLTTDYAILPLSPTPMPYSDTMMPSARCHLSMVKNR